jgi:ATP-binding cassette subfamily B (MDR/TAP) protein 1
MNVIFGQLVGQFNDYGTPDTTQTQGDFEALLNKQTIYLLALFVGRFGLSYINKVRR